MESKKNDDLERKSYPKINSFPPILILKERILSQEGFHQNLMHFILFDNMESESYIFLNKIAI